MMSFFVEKTYTSVRSVFSLDCNLMMETSNEHIIIIDSNEDCMNPSLVTMYHTYSL